MSTGSHDFLKPDTWRVTELPLERLREWSDAGPWQLLQLVPTGVILQQDIAQLVDTALRKIETEDADSQVRADVWMFWAHNFKMSKPDSGLAKGYLKEKPNFSQEDKGRFEEQARNIELTVIFFMQRTSLCQGAAGRRKRKRHATENTGNPSQAEKALSDYIRSRAKKVDALPKVEAKLAQVEATANEKLRATRMQAKKELDTASAELKSVKSQLATTNQKNEDLLSRIAGLEREVEAAKLGTKESEKKRVVHLNKLCRMLMAALPYEDDDDDESEVPRLIQNYLRDVLECEVDLGSLGKDA